MRDAPPTGPLPPAPTTKPAPFSSRLLGMKFMRRSADAAAAAKAAAEAAATERAAKWTAPAADAPAAATTPCVLVREADPAVPRGSGRRSFGPGVVAAEEEAEAEGVVDGADTGDAALATALGNGRRQRRGREGGGGVASGRVAKKRRSKE